MIGRSSSLPGVVEDSVVLEVSPSRATGRFRSLIRLIPSRFGVGTSSR